MASVTSLDQDMRKLRMDRYTPQAANEVRSWIESTIGEQLQPGDLLDALKDGVALCKLANLILPSPGIKFKSSPMPFTQRENISQFLTACELPPLNLPSHDRFLTVDLYDSKDPAQVIQCIGAFSRAANSVAPNKVRSAIGPKRTGATSPTRVPLGSEGSSAGRFNGFNRSSQSSESAAHDGRALSPALTGGSSASATPVSSWSKKSDEHASAPAWNIHQYGYMGGASQGNQGISFGARRQITSNTVDVPSLAEKERRRKEQGVEAERQRKENEAAEVRQRAQREEEERRIRDEEERQWEEETRKARDKEKQELEAERQRWEAEERRWREEEECKKQEEAANRRLNGSGLNGQFLSQYQSQAQGSDTVEKATESQRIQELERQLEEAKERERRYQLEREGRNQEGNRTPETPEIKPASYRRPDVATTPTKPLISSKPALSSKPETPSRTRDSWAPDERDQLRQAWQESQSDSYSPATQTLGSSRPLPDPEVGFSLQANPQSMRPGAVRSASQAEQQRGPDPSTSTKPPAPPPTSSRPLPDPSASRAAYSSPFSNPSTRTDRYLASNPAPTTSQPRTHYPSEIGMTSTSERAAEDARRVAGQQNTKAGGWASKSLLEKEMERERERQREWEQQQMAKSEGRGVRGPREMGSR